MKNIPIYQFSNYPKLSNLVISKNTHRIDFNNYDACIYTDRCKIYDDTTREDTVNRRKTTIYDINIKLHLLKPNLLDGKNAIFHVLN